MQNEVFKAYVVREVAKNEFSGAIEERKMNELPEGDVLIRVKYSSLNFKDALSATGNKGVTRNFPHTPGIDAAGIVEASEDTGLMPGDEVIVTGYDLGMNTDGGFAEYIQVPKSWVLKRPEGISLRECMIMGTAGLTAGLCVNGLIQHNVTPESGKVVVTGATGGVGSIAVAILAKLGYDVAAVTGKASVHETLKTLGVKEILNRDAVNDDSPKALLRPEFAGAVDTVGGNILATILKKMHYKGCVTCCGMVASPKLETSVFPFILKGVTLQGIDSVMCRREQREEIWNKLADAWKVSFPDELIQEIELSELSGAVSQILNGKVSGRVVVKCS